MSLRSEVPVKIPPRRYRPLTEAYKQEFEQRVMARIEEQLDQFVDQLADEMNDMMNPRRHGLTLSDPYSAATHFEGVTVGIVTVEEVKVKSQKTRSLRVTVHLLINNWIDQGVITRRIIVEEVFEFKEVPENKRVSLIATKLHGRASAWWQQLKLTREGWKSKSYQFEEDDEFIEETDDQLVSHYIGGLRVHIIDFVNMFDPVTLSDAYQHALAFEKQNRRVGSSSSPAITGVKMIDHRKKKRVLLKEWAYFHVTGRERFGVSISVGGVHQEISVILESVSKGVFLGGYSFLAEAI
ncbi:hypothetical protein Tco_0296342 [Tanacetum coccineum]